MSPEDPQNPNRPHATNGEDTSAFGTVDDADLDFGAPALDSTTESSYSTQGFTAGADEDRITPDHLFAPTPTPTGTGTGMVASVAPVAPVPSSTPVPPITAPVTPVAYAPVPTDTPTGSDDLDRPRSKRSTLIPIAAALAVGAVTVGAFGAYRLGVFGAPGAQPSSVIPATAVAYAGLDFNPSATEKLAAYRLAKKFPDSHVTSADSLQDDLAHNIFGHDPTINYDRDIKPWLGSRIGVAAIPVPGSPDGIEPLIAVAYTDQKTAQTDLARMKAADDAAAQPGTTGSTFVFALKDGYALLAPDQHTLDTATAATTALDDNTTFIHDTNALGNNQVARGWVDVAAITKALPADVTRTIPPALKATLHGTVALGIHLESNAVTLTGKTYGFHAPSTGGNPAPTSAPVSLADTLPADADVAFEGTGMGPAVTAAWNQISTGDPFGFKVAANGIGLHLPADINTVLGTDVAAAVKIPSNGAGTALITAETTDPAASVRTVNRLLPNLAGVIPNLHATATDYGYTLTNDPAWAHAAATHAGGLATTRTFTDAVPDAHNASGFLYVNLDHLIKQFAPADQPDLTPLQAAGLSAAHRDGVGQFTLTVTTK